jgi:hypothetical protein
MSKSKKKLAVKDPVVLSRYASANNDATQQNSNKKYDANGRLILDEAIYGPAKPGTFDLAAEVDAFQKNNIIDTEWASTNFVQETTVMPERNYEQEAIKAAGFTMPDRPADPQPEPQEEAKEPQEQNKPMTPEETIKMLSEELVSRFGNNVPSESVIKQWKSIHGNIFVLDLGGKDFFLYRYLKRQEYNQLLANPQWNSMRQDQQDDVIVEKCLLFPRTSAEQAGMVPAGRNEMIAEQIRLQSMFLNPVQVASVTVKI